MISIKSISVQQSHPPSLLPKKLLPDLPSLSPQQQHKSKMIIHAFHRLFDENDIDFIAFSSSNGEGCEELKKCLEQAAGEN